MVISQYYGSREGEKLNRCVHTAVALSLLAGVAFTVLGIAAAPWVLRITGTPADIFQQSVSYLRVYFTGMIPTLLYNMGTAILRAVGDSRRPLYFLIAASILNIGLDLLFVITFDMGVAGAALATVLSQVLSAVLVSPPGRPIPFIPAPWPWTGSGWARSPASACPRGFSR